MDISEEPAAEQAEPGVDGHLALSPTDPDNPQNWPFRRKLFASAVAIAFTFAVYVISLQTTPSLALSLPASLALLF